MKTILTLAAAVLAAALLAAMSPPLSDDIRRVNPVEYQLRIEGQITTWHDRRDPEAVPPQMNLRKTPLVFPILPEGGYHEVDATRITGRLQLDRRDADAKFEVVPTGQMGTRLARFVIEEFNGRQVNFTVEQFITVYSARVDDRALSQIGWVETWPSEVQTALQPQMYVESASESIVQLMNEWTQGRPKEVPPFLLGKELARRVSEHFRPSGKNWYNDELGQLAGLEINGALHALNERRGPSHDGICLYVAVCRAAGLPARPVIGIDMDGREKRLISWAEFYVPASGWVAVDFRELYRAPGRIRDIHQQWPGVGTNRDLNQLVPLAYHFHPPLPVRAEGLAGKPLLWGWQPIPEAVTCDQVLRYTIFRAPQRATPRRR